MSTFPFSVHCEAPRYRDHACTHGCIIHALHLESEFGPCMGDIHPHHEPFKSHGGDDYDVTAVLCDRHHRMRHAEHAVLVEFLDQCREELRRFYLSSYLNFIESVNGEAPAPKRQQRKTTRKNRGEFTKRFLPLSERPEITGKNWKEGHGR